MITYSIILVFVYLMLSAPIAVLAYGDAVQEIIFMNLTPNKVQQALVFSYVIVIALTAGMNLVPLIDINRALLPQ